MAGTVGTGTYKGLAQPLLGEYEQVQENIASIMQTLTGKSGQTADFISCRNSAGTVVFQVSAAGAFGGADNGTTAPTTATLTKDGMMMTAYLAGATASLYIRTNGTVYRATFA